MYGTLLAAAILFSGVLFALRLPLGSRYAAPLTAGLSILLGFVLARAVFWLCSILVYLGQSDPLLSLFRVREGGLSMTGALIGAAGGCLLAGRILKDPALNTPLLCDAMAPATALFIACERFMEWPLLRQNYGLDLPEAGLLTVEGHYSPVLNVSLLCGLTALVILALLLLVHPKRQGGTALLFVILYGTAQVLLESLRQDQHMLWGFVHAQQLFAFLAVFFTVMYLAQPGRRLSAFLISLSACAAIVALEFALDGRIPAPFTFMKSHVKLWWYLVMGGVLIAYMVYAVRLLYRPRKERAS